MKKIEERSYLECDGCQHAIEALAMATVLSIPWGDGIEFHFHGPDGMRHDCFRYWAHSEHVMRRSLREREWLEGEIEEFMATHLYREQAFGPGIARPA